MIGLCDHMCTVLLIFIHSSSWWSRLKYLNKHLMAMKSGTDILKGLFMTLAIP